MSQNIEDGDGGSDKSFTLVYSGTDSASYLCGNHAARSTLKRVASIGATKSWKTTQKEKDSGNLPITDGLTCWCTGNHAQGCGCVKDNIQERLRLNLTLAMMNAGTSPEKFTQIMDQVIRHTTSDCDTCEFHPKRVCSCTQKCDPLKEMKCAGKPYEVPYRVTCPYHGRAVERVLRDLMAKADRLIDEDLGRIVSNLPEKFAWVVKGYRNKEHVLQALHYKLKTNMGLLQANQNAMCKQRDSETYHWMLEVLAEAKLPIPAHLPARCEQENKDRLARLAKDQQPAAKRKRIERKAARNAAWAEKSKFVETVRTYQEGRAAAALANSQYSSAGNLRADEVEGMDVDMGDVTEQDVAGAPGRGGEAVMESMRAARDAQKAQAMQQLKQRVGARGHALVTKVPSRPAGGGGSSSNSGMFDVGAAGEVLVAEAARTSGAGAAVAANRPRSELHGEPGKCTCAKTSKCSRAPCPCAVSKKRCTEHCQYCPRPGSKCCNNAAGEACAMPIELNTWETPTPADVGFEGTMSVTPLPLPCILITGDLETSGAAGVYMNDMTQLCFKACLLSEGGAGPEINHVSTYVATQQNIPPWCQELTRITPASEEGSPLRGAPAFRDVWQRLLGMLAAARAAEGVPAGCPIVLAGHNFLQFDFVAMYCQCRREEVDLFAQLRDAGVVGLVDSLHVAREVAWTDGPPTDPDTGATTHKLGACYTALGFGLLLDAHDAAADVEANVHVLTSPPFLMCMRAPCMYGLAQCVLRARTLRQKWANMPSASREQEEVRLLVQQFAAEASAAGRLALPPASKQLRAVAHAEAKRLGITSAGGGVSEGERHVVLVQSPPST